MTTTGEKFQELLKNLFQFDCADLDFGIYRIMNDKRQVIERFIGQDLPKAVDADAGKVSHEVAAALAEKEYEKFRVTQDKTFESDFDKEVKRLKKDK
jgi:adenine-specific DNA-methyltransferase